jgi:UDP-glucose 4-epimerase
MEAVRRIEAIVGKSVPFENVDLTNLDAVKAVFAKYPIDSVIHFAALKVAINEVVADSRLLERVRRSHWSIIALILVGLLI